ncbi:hypothetical protein M5K25_001782 [Dendrobium thyrsiflorum]|uniref:Uncharacterized protein n=1 Tax=Dendrobium thyrsiflorum TaxID=117978 RepID=A0ABD0VZF7_DENTH
MAIHVKPLRKTMASHMVFNKLATLIYPFHLWTVPTILDDLLSPGGYLYLRRILLKLPPMEEVHPSNLTSQEPEANISTWNKFIDLSWVKRNTSTRELKKSFWDQRPELPTPKKKGAQKPLSMSLQGLEYSKRDRGKERKYIQHSEHLGVTLKLHIRGSTIERSQHKGRELWRLNPHKEENTERIINLGMKSDTDSRRSTSTNKQRQRWVKKKTSDDARHDG